MRPRAHVIRRHSRTRRGELSSGRTSDIHPFLRILPRDFTGRSLSRDIAAVIAFSRRLNCELGTETELIFQRGWIQLRGPTTIIIIIIITAILRPSRIAVSRQSRNSRVCATVAHISRPSFVPCTRALLVACLSSGSLWLVSI